MYTVQREIFNTSYIQRNLTSVPVTATQSPSPLWVTFFNFMVYPSSFNYKFKNIYGSMLCSFLFFPTFLLSLNSTSWRSISCSKMYTLFVLFFHSMAVAVTGRYIASWEFSQRCRLLSLRWGGRISCWMKLCCSHYWNFQSSTITACTPSSSMTTAPIT